MASTRTGLTIVEPEQAPTDGGDGLAAAVAADDATDDLDVRVYELIARPGGATWLEVRTMTGRLGDEASTQATAVVAELLKADRIRQETGPSFDSDNPRYFSVSARETLEDLLDPEPLPESIAIPTAGQFGEKDALRAPELVVLARSVVDEHGGQFGHLRGKRIDFWWRAEGGMSRGRPTFFRVRMPTQELAGYTEADLVISLAADHCAAAGFGVQELRNLLLRAFCSIGISEKTGALKLRGPEFDGWLYELQVLGPWMTALKAMAARIVQPSLFADGDEGADGEDEVEG